MRKTYGSGLELGKEIDHFNMPNGNVITMDDIQDELDFYYDELKAKHSFNESAENVEPVIFKKDKRDGEVIAFFPETMFDGSVNRGNIMCYAHNGQSSEASLEYFQECRPCKDESEYAELLDELEDYFNQLDADDIQLKVVKKPSYVRGKTRRQMWPTRAY
jgi:hypothetical protein